MNDNPLKRKEGLPISTGSVFYGNIEVLSPVYEPSSVSVAPKAIENSSADSTTEPKVGEPDEAPREILRKGSVVPLSEHIEKMWEAILNKAA